MPSPENSYREHSNASYTESSIEIPEGFTEDIRVPLIEKNDLVVYRKDDPPTHPGFASGKCELRILVQDRMSKRYVLDFGEVAKLAGFPSKIIFREDSNADETNWFAHIENLDHPIVSGKRQVFPRDIRTIFWLLHELGHFTDRYKALRDHLSTVDSKPLVAVERDAWAEAIRLARSIKKEFSIDLFKLFSGSDELKGWLRAESLWSYEDRQGSASAKIHPLQEKQVELWRKKKAEEGKVYPSDDPFTDAGM